MFATGIVVFREVLEAALIVSIVMIPLAFYPSLLDIVARWLGIASGVSLVLFLAIVFLLLVCVHLSWEVSRLEEETRTLAEEIALIRTEWGSGHARPEPTVEPETDR